LHPSVRIALDKVLKDGFVHTILEDQDCFRTEDGAEALLRLLPDKGACWSPRLHLPSGSARTDFADPLRHQWKKEAAMSALRKYNSVMGIANGLKAGKVRSPDQCCPVPGAECDSQDKDRAFEILEDIVLQYTYPRIDTEVSKHLNHLLKSPFCIHPGTGRVCVPLSLDEITTFEPEKVPTVGQLLRELNAAGAKATGEGKASLGWEVTSLKPYVERFAQHVEGLMRETRDSKKGAQARLPPLIEY
jgi:DNA primase small subunit